jgi:DNA replication and repair protein RecF
MILNSIRLKNFRIHKYTELDFSGKLNYIVGGNGEGKTSILESIYYLCTTKSFNAKADNEVLRFNESEFEIEGLFTDSTKDKVRVIYSSLDNKKNYFQNNKIVSRSTEVIGRFPVVVLTPADHAITQGSPSERRKFVDSVISQATETYLRILLDYNKILRQRSSLLTRIKENSQRILTAELEAWTEKLVEAGTELIEHRIKFIKGFNDYIRESYKVILENNEVPGIYYSFLENYDGNEIRARFMELLAERREDEQRRATNLVGPHRDDYILEINGINLRTFGSQGQHKTYQVVLRFAEFFYLKEITGKTPLFLLDDVFGELDTDRSVKISEYLTAVGQSFITLTDFSNLSFLQIKEENKVFRIKKGVIANA